MTTQFVLEELEIFGYTVTQEIKFNMELNKVNATNETSSSLRHVTDKTGFTLYGSEVFTWTERGRGRTRAQGTGALRFAILKWIRAKGIKANNISDESLSWAITKKIHSEGSAIYRLLNGGTSQYYTGKAPREIFSNVLSEERVKNLINIVAARVKAEALSDIINSFK